MVASSTWTTTYHEASEDSMLISHKNKAPQSLAIEASSLFFVSHQHDKINNQLSSINS